MAQPSTPSLRAFNGDKIPQFLKDQKRWAPWKAVWKEKKQKYDKIPCYPSGLGLSTAKPERWMTYADAFKALEAKPDQFAGLGYVMTGSHGVIGTDLDHCIVDNKIEPWAQSIIDSMASYTELSPSGTGLRILSLGRIEADWTNHEVGVEIYAGHQPRFLTVTGSRLKTSVQELTDVDPFVYNRLATQYAKERTTTNVLSLHMPDLLDELSLPDISDLGLHYKASDFLTEGKLDGDRSHTLHATGVALYSAGLTDEQVFSLLANNPFAMEVALDHRRQDTDRALMYLWIEHCQKAKGKASPKVATADDFEDVSPAHTPGAEHNVADDFEDVSGQAPAAAVVRDKFHFDEPDVFADAKPVEWIVKKVLPKGEVGVLYGASGAGKSFFTLDLVLAIARGEAWRGHRVRQGTVAYICAEGAGGFRLRLKAYSQFNGIPLKGLPLRILGDAPNFMDKADIKELVKALKAIPGLDLIVVDTWAQVTAGANENSGEDMGRALGHCKVLHRVTGAMVLLVAHSGKDESRGMRGWSGVKGALDVEICVERSDDYRSAIIKKVKDGEGEGEEFAFSLETVVLGQDEDGDNITSCVVKGGNTVAKAERKVEPKGSVQQVVLRTAIALTDLPGTVTTTTQLIDASVDQIPKDDTKKVDRRRDNVLRAIESLTGANRISTQGGVIDVL
jgi:hypothetical protein